MYLRSYLSSFFPTNVVGVDEITYICVYIYTYICIHRTIENVDISPSLTKLSGAAGTPLSKGLEHHFLFHSKIAVMGVYMIFGQT